MSAPITQDDLYKILQGYEDKLKRLENRLQNQPDTPIGGVITYAGRISTDWWLSGAINPNATYKVPHGFLYCDGTAVSRLDYAALWDVLRAGTTSSPYGNGDGSTTFNLPDLRGRMVLGNNWSVDLGAGSNLATGNGRVTSTIARGEAGGEHRVTLGTNEMPNHGHVVSEVNPVWWASASNRATGGGGEGHYIRNVDGNARLRAENTGGGANHNNVPPYQIFNFIIRAV